MQGSRGEGEAWLCTTPAFRSRGAVPAGDTWKQGLGRQRHGRGEALYAFVPWGVGARGSDPQQAYLPVKHSQEQESAVTMA